MRLVRAAPAPLPHLSPHWGRSRLAAGPDRGDARRRGGEATVDASFTRMMDECLACRACAACPSGVPFGRMIEAARAQTEPTRTARARGVRRIGLTGVLPRRRLVLAAGWALGVARALRLDRVAPAAQRAAMPPVSLAEMRTPIPGALGAGPVAKVLSGCVMDVAFRPTQRATMRVVADAGYRGVRTPAGACCGALAMHYGQPQAARAMARARIAELEGADLVVVNASGCSAHVKSYGELLADDPAWAARAARVASRTRDLIELTPPARDAGLGRVAVHDACHHIHAQGIDPRAMLAAAGADCVDLGDGGAAAARPGSTACCSPRWPRGCGARRRPRSPRPEPAWWRWPTPAAPSRSPPDCARWDHRSGWPIPRSCSRPSRRSPRPLAQDVHRGPRRDRPAQRGGDRVGQAHAPVAHRLPEQARPVGAVEGHAAVAAVELGEALSERAVRVMM